jgi:ABC-type multidrug transport system fused ATPase/permease subunit
MEEKNLRGKYIAEAESYRALEAREERILLLLSVMRLFIFAAGGVLIWIGFSIRAIAGILAISAVAGLFMYLLRLYSLHSEKKIFFANLALVNSNEALALAGDLHAFESGIGYADPHHDFSNDVDLFGPGSLFQFLNRTVTGYGRDLLASWLSDPYVFSGEMKPRQEAVHELAGNIRWRQEFMALGMRQPLEKSNISGLMNWLAERDFARSRYVCFLLIYVIPSVTLITLALASFGLVNFSFFIFIFLLNLLIVASGLKGTNRIHRSVSGMHGYLSSIHRLLGIFGRESFSSPLLEDIRRNISGNRISASAAIKQLSRIIQAFDSRLNLLMGFLLNGLLLWDYQNLKKLEKWKNSYRELLPAWLEMAGRIDAFASLANFAFNNPSFAFPDHPENGELFSAISLGHPLIEMSKRICNDYSIAGRGDICIITGANMSGKSTFLRTVAVNYILAMTGAPVCAERMRFTPMKLFTSMRTTDSLSDNESYFYAELRRLKKLKALIGDGEPVLFILDEILKGTNSADKSLGSKLFIARIVRLDGTGLIATHDTSLGELENEFPGKISNMCFEIEIDRDKINFDYKLSHGITRTMNASLLMKQMGILD